MAKETLEQVIREKLSTGYDPIQLAVSARSINEENVEVTIEGFPFSVKGNDVSTLGRPARGGATEIEPAADTVEGEGEGAGVVSSESTEPAPLTPYGEAKARQDDIQARINELLEVEGVAGYQEIAPLESGGELRYSLVDSYGHQLALGTLDELEAQAFGKKESPAA